MMKRPTRPPRSQPKKSHNNSISSLQVPLARGKIAALEEEKKSKCHAKEKREQHVGSSLGCVYDSYSRLVMILEQANVLIGKAHELRMAMKFASCEIERFSEALAGICSTVQEWILFFEEAAKRPTFPFDSDNMDSHGTIQKCEISSAGSGEDTIPWLGFKVGEGWGTGSCPLSDSPLLPGLEQDRFNVCWPDGCQAFFEEFLIDHLLPSPDQSQDESPSKQKSPTKGITVSEAHDCPIPAKSNLGKPILSTEIPGVVVPPAMPSRPDAIGLMEQSKSEGSVDFSPLALPKNLSMPSLSNTVGLMGSGESPQAMELVTPQPPQSLLRKYSRTIIFAPSSSVCEESPMMLETPMLPSSPPRTCILLKPTFAETVAKQNTPFKSPVIVLKSPFRTPGLYLRRAGSISRALSPASTEMLSTSVSRPGLPAPANPTLPAISEYSTPSLVLEEMQFTTVMKPGFHQPGEQTLKRELWTKLEAEFASNISDVCKSLFPETKNDSPNPSSDSRKGEEGQQMGHFKLKLPKRLRGILASLSDLP